MEKEDDSKADLKNTADFKTQKHREQKTREKNKPEKKEKRNREKKGEENKNEREGRGKRTVCEQNLFCEHKRSSSGTK